MLDGAVERQRTGLVIGGNIHKSGGETSPPAARFALRADDPAAQLDRLLPGEGGGEGRIGGVEQMVPLVEHDARRRPAFVAATRGIDHDERVVGDDEVGVLAGAGGALDEAAAVMGAAGIDAFAAPVGQRRSAGAAESEVSQPGRSPPTMSPSRV